MTQGTGMIRAGGLILLVAGALGLGAVLDPSAGRQVVVLTLGAAGVTDWQPGLVDLIARTQIALGLDFALFVVIVTGQLVLGLALAAIGGLLAPRLMTIFCDLTAALSLPVLAIVMLGVLDLVLEPGGLLLTTVPTALMIAGAPGIALTLLVGMRDGLRTPWYLGAREAGLSALAAFRRHLWVGLKTPLLRSLASQGLQTLAILLALGAYQSGWVGLEPTLGGLLKFGLSGVHAVDLWVIAVPCVAVVGLFLGLVLIRRGCGS